MAAKTVRNIRRVCFAGLFGTGVLAGLFEHLWNGSPLSQALCLGSISTFLAASLGGFSGFFLINVLRTLRRRKAYAGQTNDGVLMMGFAASFVGILLQLLFGQSPEPVWGATVGAFLGGAVGAIPDEFLQPMLLWISGERPFFSDEQPELVFEEPVDQDAR